MSQFYKPLDQSNDVTNTRTLLHEAIPLTGTIVSGTYGTNNIKEYSHGMFQSSYDYPYLSSSANHIFDITAGYANNSVLSGATANQNSKKINVYTQMAQVLMGYDQTGSIVQFDEDGDILAGGTKLRENVFFNFSRLLVKDEIKKGSFQMEFGVANGYSEGGTVFGKRIKVSDESGSTGFLVNSPVGEYGILFATQSYGGGNYLKGNNSYPVGLLFYQAGVAVVSSSVFHQSSDGGILKGDGTSNNVSMSGPSGIDEKFDAVLTGSTVSTLANNLRTRLYNLQFNNTIELNSSIYYCRVHNNDFNYSSNPTYLSGSKIRVKTQTTDVPVTYITTVGLYSNSNELLAVAKLSEPLKKTPDNEFTIRVRLDY
jgi:hypothetical protein